MSQRVFITGYGIITSIGSNASENLNSLVKGTFGFGDLNFLETVHQKTLPSCEIKSSDGQLRDVAGIKIATGFTRTTLLGLIAVKEAIKSAGLSSVEIENSGLISATTTGGIREFEKYFYNLLDLQQQGDFTQFSDTANPGEHCERIADHVGIKKYLGTISTACSSSANAIMQGAQLIKNNKLDRVICGGAEALSRFTINGFNSLMIVDTEHCKPFDASRKGLNLGEGAAYVVLESEDVIIQQGKTPLAELKGYGNANDAFHQTASSLEGIGAMKAMQLALDGGKIPSSDIDYINAHGTATENNDLSEGMGIQTLFADGIPYFSSTKPFTGHTLAAAGSIEAVFSLMALQNRMIWPNLNFSKRMPELSISPVQKLMRNIPLRNVLSNSFGFGGNTSSLLLATA